MATTQADLFHDDLMAVLRKHGLDDEATTKGHALRDALYELEDEAERLFDARGPAHSCDHCGSLVTRLYAAREPKGGLLSLCSLCRDGMPRRD